jgi:hypothetical protein
MTDCIVAGERLVLLPDRAAWWPAARTLFVADFHLGSRLFKNRCSYMIYSQAFTQLPARVRSATLKRLRAVLDGAEAQEEFAYLKEPERKRISAILKETLPGFSN